MFVAKRNTIADKQTPFKENNPQNITPKNINIVSNPINNTN